MFIKEKPSPVIGNIRLVKGSQKNPNPKIKDKDLVLPKANDLIYYLGSI